MGLAGTGPAGALSRAVPVRAAQTGEPRLHRAARAAVRVTVQSRRCVAQHGSTRVCIWILHALCAQPRNLFVCFRTGGQAVAVHAGLLCEARRHLVESDIDGVMIADFVSGTPAEYEAYRQLEPDAPESPLAAKILAQALRETYGVHITPAAVYHSMNDMRRMHHLRALRRSVCAQPSAAVRAPDRQIRFCVLAHPSDRAARGGLHQSGAPSVDIPHRRANGFILRSV